MTPPYPEIFHKKGCRPSFLFVLDENKKGEQPDSQKGQNFSLSTCLHISDFLSNSSRMVRLPLFLVVAFFLLCTAFSLRPQPFFQRQVRTTTSSTTALLASSPIKSLQLVVASSLVGLFACQGMVLAKGDEGTKTDKKFGRFWYHFFSPCSSHL